MPGKPLPPLFELFPCDDGSFTLKDPKLAESMHSKVGPYREAMSLYVEQSGLVERLAGPSKSDLVIYDVGLGIAANAVAAIDRFLETAGIRRLEIHSFEKYPEGLARALSELEKFPFLMPHRAAIETLLKRGQWTSADQRIHWSLHVGDFARRELPDARPEIVFFDFYSSKVNPELWGLQVFRKLRQACRETAPGTLICTYSAATAVRAAMVLAGFYVGVGVSTSTKSESTTASNLAEHVLHPLTAEWLVKFERSSRALPIDVEPEWGRRAVVERLRVLPKP